MKRTAIAHGKIMLSGEYAVVHGYPGIAVPAPCAVTVTFTEDTTLSDIELEWPEGNTQWHEYVHEIISHCITLGSIPPGTLHIENTIPLGKGMGSSTALVIAIARCLLGNDCREQALTIEDAINPGHSGLDFVVIWENRPMLFQKDRDPQPIDLPDNLFEGAFLIDTGTPGESTAELVALLKKEDLSDTYSKIGQCTERLLNGENFSVVLRDHHREQCRLGIVNEQTQKLIADIEQQGGAAKVLGAGCLSGGNGMVLALGIAQHKLPQNFPVDSSCK